MTPSEALDFIEQVRLQASMPGHQADQFREAVTVLAGVVRGNVTNVTGGDDAVQ